MDKKVQRIKYRFGKVGSMVPLIVAAAMILWAAHSRSNVNGYVLAFFAALVTGIIFTNDEKSYGEALVYGLGKPMFAVIVMAAGALLLFLLFSKNTDERPAIGEADDPVNPVSLIMLVVPVVIIVLCMMRKHLITALSWGILAGISVELLSGIYTMENLVAFPGGFSVSGAIIEAIKGSAV